MNDAIFTGYKKVKICDSNKFFKWWFEDDFLKNKKVMFKNVEKIMEYINFEKILKKSIYVNEPVIQPTCFALYNKPIEEFTGLSLKQVKRTKEFMSKIGLIEYIKCIFVDDKFIHLWVVNENRCFFNRVKVLNGKVIGFDNGEYDPEWEKLVYDFTGDQRYYVETEEYKAFISEHNIDSSFFEDYSKIIG